MGCTYRSEAVYWIDWLSVCGHLGSRNGLEALPNFFGACLLVGFEDALVSTLPMQSGISPVM